MRCLVVGASGFLGSHLTRELLRQGHSVRAMVRSAARGMPLRALGADILSADLSRRDTLRGAAEDVDVVVHLASAMRGPWSEFERIDLHGTAHLLEEAARAGSSRVVYVNTLAGYPLAQLPPGATIDESTPFDDSGRLGCYARAKCQVEPMVLEAAKKGDIEAVVIRLGLVCGPGTSVIPPHVGFQVGKHVIMFGDGSIPLPLTYVDNAIDALIRGAATSGIDGECFNIVDDDVLTQREYLALLNSETGGAYPVLRLPTAAYYGIGAVSEALSALRRKEPVTSRYRVRTRLSSVRWRCDKAKQALGWRPQVPLKVGLAATFRRHALRP